MLRLDKINVEVSKMTSSRIALSDMEQQPPQQFPVALMVVSPGANLESTLRLLAKNIAMLVNPTTRDPNEEELVKQMRSVVENALPPGLAKSSVITELDLPGETFAYGDSQGNMVIVSISTSYRGITLGAIG